MHNHFPLEQIATAHFCMKAEFAFNSGQRNHVSLPHDADILMLLSSSTSALVVPRQ
jgi:hypothetical protein